VHQCIKVKLFIAFAISSTDLYLYPAFSITKSGKIFIVVGKVLAPQGGYRSQKAIWPFSRSRDDIFINACI